MNDSHEFQYVGISESKETFAPAQKPAKAYDNIAPLTYKKLSARDQDPPLTFKRPLPDYEAEIRDLAA